LIHYAAYLRNFNLLEALIPKADLKAVNSKGNNALHLAVAIKRSNQLELPKIEDLLITKHPQLLV
jgi:ankyrin repeat protein